MQETILRSSTRRAPGWFFGKCSSMANQISFAGHNSERHQGSQRPASLGGQRQGAHPTLLAAVREIKYLSVHDFVPLPEGQDRWLKMAM